MTTFTIDDDAPILVETMPQAGIKQVSVSPAEVAQKSKEAIDSAMNTIHQMAQRVVLTVDTLANRPSEVEVEFSLKLNAEVGKAIIAKATAEGSMKVKLTWKRKDESDGKP